MDRYSFAAQLCALSVFLVSSASTPAAAGSASFSLSPTAGIYTFDRSRDLKDAPVYGFRVGYDIEGDSVGDSLGFEGGVGFVSTEADQRHGDATLALFRIEALYPFLPKGRFVPALAVGGGGFFLDGEARSEQSPFVNYGATLKYFLTESLAVRGDARHLLVYDQGTRSHFEFTLGISFALTRDQKLKRIPPSDADKDGVPDDQDLCPETPKGVKVDSKGCLQDKDGDGVPDSRDKCSDTPKGTKTDKDGCPDTVGGSPEKGESAPVSVKSTESLHGPATRGREE